MRRPEPLLEAERLTLAVLGCGVAALALSDFVSPFYWLLAASAGLLRLWFGPGLALREMQASLIGWAGFVWVSIELALGRAFLVALTDFLLILALAVIIEEATPRNHLHRILVSGFLILAAAVLTDSVLYALPLLAFLLLLWRAAQRLYGLQHGGQALPLAGWGADVRMGLVMAAASALLFVALPRFDFHSVLRPTQPRMRTSGFSEQVQLGDFARSLDPTVVLRVEAAHAGDAKRLRHLIQGRYWRGVALGRFTGDGWRQLPHRITGSWHRGTVISRGDGGTAVAVYREATDQGAVMLPDGWLGIGPLPGDAVTDSAGDLRFLTPPAHRLRLLMRIGPPSPAGHDMRPPQPAERDVSAVPPAVFRWAESVAGNARTDADKAGRLVSELRGWTYDLHAPIDPKQPVLSFLRQRRGYCEMYATLLALGLRTLGIPSRVVDGYYGGEWDRVGGFLLIRQTQAHSWVEAWIGGRWRREDGTPASRWALSGVPFPRLDDIWEAVKLSWYRYVLAFEAGDRGRLLAGLWQGLRPRIPLALSALALLILAARGLRRLRLHGRRRAAWPLLDAWLRRRGWPRPPSMPLRAVPTPSGIDGERWRDFVAAWEAQAFGAVKPWRRKELRRNLRAISAARW